MPGRRPRHAALQRPVLAGLLATAAAAPLPAAAQPAVPGASIYVCVDAQGRRITSDRPIPECLNKEQRELGPSGALRRTIAPTPTGLEKAAEEERRKREAAQRAQAEEELRRERLLVARYPNQAAHDAERTAALRRTEEAETFARQRLAQLQQQKKDIEAAMATYRQPPGRPVPASLRQELEDNARAAAVQERAIAEQAHERQRIGQRFDAELARLRLTWGAHAAPLHTGP